MISQMAKPICIKLLQGPNAFIIQIIIENYSHFKHCRWYFSLGGLYHNVSIKILGTVSDLNIGVEAVLG